MGTYQFRNSDKQFESEPPKYEPEYGERGDLTVYATITTVQGDKTIRLPEEFIRNSLHQLAKDILSHPAEEDSVRVDERLSDLWKARLAHLTLSGGDTVLYSGDTAKKGDLPIREIWGDEDDGLTFYVFGGTREYKPITKEQREIQEDLESEELDSASNFKQEFDPDTGRYEFLVKTEVILGMTQTRVAPKEQLASDLLERCKEVLTTYVLKPENDPEYLDKVDVELLGYYMNEKGTELLKAEGLYYKDFDQAKPSTTWQTLGEFGQNPLNLSSANVGERAKRDLARLIKLTPRRSEDAAFYDSRDFHCREMVEQLSNKQPSQVSLGQWSETLQRATNLTFQSLEQLRNLTYMKGDWGIRVNSALCRRRDPSKLAMPSDDDEVIPRGIFGQTADEEEADMIAVVVDFKADQCEPGEADAILPLCLTIRGGPSSRSYQYSDLTGWEPAVEHDA